MTDLRGLGFASSVRGNLWPLSTQLAPRNAGELALTVSWNAPVYVSPTEVPTCAAATQPAAAATAARSRRADGMA